MEFEIDEITKAELKLGEDEEQQKIFDRLSHRKKIMDILSSIENTFYDAPDFSSMVSKYIGELNRVVAYDEDLTNVLESLAQIEDILNMIHHDLSKYMDDEENYEEVFYHAQERLNTINGLKLKYGDTLVDILEYKNNKEDELADLIHYEKKNYSRPKNKIHALEIKNARKCR